MTFENLAPHAIASELGNRIKVARLNANLTQKKLAEKAGLSLKAVTNGEKGKSTLESIIAILVALEMTDQLNFFIPAQEVSPIQLIKLQGKKRKRATSPNKKLTKDLAETLTADNSQRKDDQKW